MLTTSPRIPASANASPSAFHYAPARASQQPSSPRLSASLTRRHSLNESVSSSVPMVSPPGDHQRQPAPRSRQDGPMKPNARRLSMKSVAEHGDVEDHGSQKLASSSSTEAAPSSQSPSAPRSRPINSLAPQEEQQQDQRQPQPRPPQSQPHLKSSSPPAVVKTSDSSTTATATSAATKAQILREPETNTLSPGKRRKSQDSIAHAKASPILTEKANSSPISNKRQRPAPAPQKVLPRKYEFCSGDDMVVLIAHMLSELIETNDALALRSGSLTRFHSRTAPSISVLDYLNRLAKHATLTPPLLLSMVYYIDRLCALYPEFTINTLTVHRFLITAATVAAKGLSDSFWNNTTYARVGGVRVAELKLLELEFLHRVDWKIVPNPEVLEAYYRGLVERCSGYTLEGAETSSSASRSGLASTSTDADEDEDEEGSTDVSDDGDADADSGGGSVRGSSPASATGLGAQT